MLESAESEAKVVGPATLREANPDRSTIRSGGLVQHRLFAMRKPRRADPFIVRACWTNGYSLADKKLTIRQLILTALLCFTTAGCFNPQAWHPPLDSTESMILLSTSAEANSTISAKGLVLFRIGDDGKRTVVTGYFMSNTFEPIDLPQANANVRWRGLPPGNYVIEMAATNLCYRRAPEIFFHVDPMARLYLGDFHEERDGLAILDHLERDKLFFESINGPDEKASFKYGPLDVKTVTYDTCDRQQPGPTVIIPLGPFKR